jgi:hypothetical protein
MEYEEALSIGRTCNAELKTTGMLKQRRSHVTLQFKKRLNRYNFSTEIIYNLDANRM